MEATFLTKQQIWGDEHGNGQLQVMKSYGTSAGMSDLAIALGGLMGSSSKTSDNQLSGHLWSASSNANGYVRTVHRDGGRYYYEPYGRVLAARPALPSSVTSLIKPRESRLSRNIGDIEVMEYGEYPQTITKPDAAKELNGLSIDELEKIKTGKKYTFDGEKLDAYDKPFKAKEYDEYQHNGKRHIRVEAQPCDSDSVLSNGHRVQRGDKCWIEVKPIEWLKDPSGVWVARQALFSGVQFDRNPRYDGDFAKTDMKQYLDRHFSKEMRVDERTAHKAHRQEQLARARANKAYKQEQGIFSLSDLPDDINTWELEDRIGKIALRWDEREKAAKFPAAIGYHNALIEAMRSVRQADNVENEAEWHVAVQDAFAKNVVQRLRAAGRLGDDSNVDDGILQKQVKAALKGDAELPGVHTPTVDSHRADRVMESLERQQAEQYGEETRWHGPLKTEKMMEDWASRRARLKNTPPERQ